MSTAWDKGGTGHDAPKGEVTKTPPQRKARGYDVGEQPKPARGRPTAGKVGATKHKVAVISGHSNSDPGAVGNGIKESERNKALNAYVTKRLRAHGITTYTDLEHSNPGAGGEVSLTNKWGPTLTMSIHHNAASASARGIETYKTGSARSYRFAKAVHAAALAALRKIDSTYKNRGVKEANGTRAEYFVMKSAGSAILLEGGFLSNSADAKVIKRADYVARIGEAIVKAIVNFGRAEKLWTTVYVAPAVDYDWKVTVGTASKVYGRIDDAMGVVKTNVKAGRKTIVERVKG